MKGGKMQDYTLINLNNQHFPFVADATEFDEKYFDILFAKSISGLIKH